MMRSALVLALLPAILAHGAVGDPSHVKPLRRAAGHMARRPSHQALDRRQANAGIGGGGVGVGVGVGVGGGSSSTDDSDVASSVSTTTRTTVTVFPTGPIVNPPITTSSTSTRTSSTTSGTITTSSAVSETTSASRSISSSANVTGPVTSASNTSSSTASSTSSAQSLSMSVDPAGKTIVITQFLTASASSATSSAGPASSAAAVTDGNEKQGNSISTGAIIGIAVGVGAVVIALIACAVWRMRRRTMDEDEAIRWPELNRHGDATVHHALPARATGKHGIETDPLERISSDDADSYERSSHGHGMSPRGPAPMALNGSSFGAPSNLDYDMYDEKAHGATDSGYNWPATAPYGGYPIADANVPQAPTPAVIAGARSAPPDLDDDYTSFPPAMTPATQHPGAAGLYDSSSSDDETHHQQQQGAAAAGITRSGSAGAGRMMAVANPDPVTRRLE